MELTIKIVVGRLRKDKPKFGSWIMGLAAKDAKIAKNMCMIEFLVGLS